VCLPNYIYKVSKKQLQKCKVINFLVLKKENLKAMLRKFPNPKHISCIRVPHSFYRSRYIVLLGRTSPLSHLALIMLLNGIEALQRGARNGAVGSEKPGGGAVV
jgi:hypothetical protein